MKSIYERKHKPAFSNIKEIFQSIIKHSGARLRLSPLAFEPRGQAYHWNFKCPSNSLEGKAFLDFIERCCSVGASHELDRVVEETFSGLLEAQSTWILVQHQADIITDTLAPIIRMFQDGRLKPVLAFGNVLELLVRMVIKYDLPQSPHSRREWEFSPRGCNACADCADINQFLTSPTQLVWKFTAPGNRGTHIEHALRLDVSMSIMSRQEPQRGRSLTLTVTKKKAQPSPVIEWRQQTFRQLKDAVQPLEGDWMKAFLGEQRYREIILLEGVTPYANPPSLAGTRRPAPEGEIQPNKRHCTSLQASDIGTGPAIKQEVIVIDD